jgi:hypothetical protein
LIKLTAWLEYIQPINLASLFLGAGAYIENMNNKTNTEKHNRNRSKKKEATGIKEIHQLTTMDLFKEQEKPGD